jgi:hypothetical protein
LFNSELFKECDFDTMEIIALKNSFQISSSAALIRISFRRGIGFLF